MPFKGFGRSVGRTLAFLGKVWGSMDILKHEIQGLPRGHSITLRRKVEGQVWTARIKTGKAVAVRDFGRVERSTGFRDLEPAITEAHRLYNELLEHPKRANQRRRRSGLSFSDLVTLFLENEKSRCDAGEISQAQYEREKISLQRHFVPEFGARSIRTIAKSDLADFLTRRRQNLHRADEDNEIVYERGGKTLRYRKRSSKPTAETLRRERSGFNALVNWAIDNNHLSEDEAPRYPTLKGASARRPHFSPEAIQMLQHVSIKRILNTQHPKRRRERIMCHLRMMTMYLTGCRPQEVAALRFRDIDPCVNHAGEATAKVYVRPGRLKHPKHIRAVIAQPQFNQIFPHCWPTEVGFSDEDFLFAGPDREMLGPCNGSFKELVKAAACEVRPDIAAARIDEASVYYSLRHTFITERLYEGMDVGKVARLCGTSIEMIQDHYDHVRTEIEQSARIGRTGHGPYVVPIPSNIWHDDENGWRALDFYEEFRDPPPESDHELDISPEERDRIVREFVEDEENRPILRSRNQRD